MHSFDAANVSINYDNRRIYVDGEAFFIKGINYLPVPVGYSSWNIDVFSDRRIIDRDIENLKYLGVNAVRIHHLRLKNIQDKIYLLDRLYQNGIYAVIGRSLNDCSWSDPKVRKTILDDWKIFVQTFKTHPAVLMWIFGNEMNQPEKWDVPAAFSLLKEIKQVTHDLEGPNYWHPVTTALKDGYHIESIMKFDDCVDLWSYQLYRGSSFYNAIDQAFMVTQKPLIITEYGIDSYDSTKMREDQESHESISTKLYLEIYQHAIMNKVAGGFYFKYADDWWKLKNATVQDTAGWYAPGFPDMTANEEWFGLYSIQPISGQVDFLNPKKMAQKFSDLNLNFHPYVIWSSTPKIPHEETSGPMPAESFDKQESRPSDLSSIGGSSSPTALLKSFMPTQFLSNAETKKPSLQPALSIYRSEAPTKFQSKSPTKSPGILIKREPSAKISTPTKSPVLAISQREPSAKFPPSQLQTQIPSSIQPQSKTPTKSPVLATSQMKPSTKISPVQQPITRIPSSIRSSSLKPN
jgi:hypothetical protein